MHHSGYLVANRYAYACPCKHSILFYKNEQLLCYGLSLAFLLETGAVTITPNPAPRGVKPKPGFPMKPFYGVLPVLVDEEVFRTGIGWEYSHYIFD